MMGLRNAARIRSAISNAASSVDGTVEQHPEFVPTQAGARVGRADRGPQAAGQLLEDLIADRVPEALVDALEAVQADREDDRVVPGTSRARQRLVHSIVEQ